TITLLHGELAIDHSVTISGPGAGKLSISGNNVSRIFSIGDSGSGAPTVSISGLTLKNGLATGNPLPSGGAIRVQHANVTLQHSVVSGSSASWGGGLYAYDRAGESLILDDVSISGNSTTSGYGAGIYFIAAAATIANSFVGGNTSGKGCGGVWFTP